MFTVISLLVLPLRIKVINRFGLDLDYSTRVPVDIKSNYLR